MLYIFQQTITIFIRTNSAGFFCRAFLLGALFLAPQMGHTEEDSSVARAVRACLFFSSGGLNQEGSLDALSAKRIEAGVISDEEVIGLTYVNADFYFGANSGCLLKFKNSQENFSEAAAPNVQDLIKSEGEVFKLLDGLNFFSATGLSAKKITAKSFGAKFSRRFPYDGGVRYYRLEHGYYFSDESLAVYFSSKGKVKAFSCRLSLGINCIVPENTIGITQEVARDAFGKLENPPLKGDALSTHIFSISEDSFWVHQAPNPTNPTFMGFGSVNTPIHLCKMLECKIEKKVYFVYLSVADGSIIQSGFSE